MFRNLLIKLHVRVLEIKKRHRILFEKPIINIKIFSISCRKNIIAVTIRTE
jgi:hypothetical protein